MLVLGEIWVVQRTLEGQLADFEALVGALIGRNNWSIADQRIVDTWIWHQIRLELIQVNVQGAIETQTGGDRANNLSDQPIQVLVIRSWNIEVTTAYVIDSLIIDQERAVRVLNSAMGRQHRVIGLDYGGRDARCGIHRELQLALFAKVSSEVLEKERTESRTSATTEGVEDEKTLQRRAAVCNLD